jgi:ATP-dependent DNA ligase
MPLWLRRQELQKIVSGIIDCDIPDIHKHLTISSVTSIYHADEVPHLSASALARGREGIMIKNANGLYEGTRSSAWMKYKPWDTSTFIIVGYEKGSVGSKNEDRLGAVIVEGTVSIRGKNVSVRCKAGQGFKDKERDEFHELYLTNQLFGKIIDLKYQKFDEAAVLSSTDDVIALRNAVFKGFRSDLE